MAEKLIISKRGNDGHKVFSVRIKEDTVVKIDEVAKNTERSRNEIINILLEYGLENCEIEK